MARRDYTLHLKCADPDCKERSHWRYETRADYVRGCAANQNWKCMRHSQPQLVLSPSNARTTTVAVVVESGGRRYWNGPGTLMSGFTAGPGYRAFTEDFPVGTTLTVTAEVKLP